jgi:hypothetical protein
MSLLGLRASYASYPHSHVDEQRPAKSTNEEDLCQTIPSEQRETGICERKLMANFSIPVWIHFFV